MTCNIVIVGAGVIGLTCAYQLVVEKQYPASKIVIVAEYFPSTGLLEPTYTSSKSGAHFRPFPSKSPEEFRDSKLTRRTYEHFKKLAITNPESSIKWIKGIDYIEHNDVLYEKLAPGYTEGIDDFKVIPKKDLPKGITFGASYKTWTMNSPAYLEFLEKTLRVKYGVKFTHIKLKSLRELSKAYPEALFMNCTGTGLQFDGGTDPLSYSIRGQTLLIGAKSAAFEEKTITYQLANGSWIFVIPRPLNGGIILGGTKQINDNTKEPKRDDTEHLIKLGKKYFPEYLVSNEFDIKRINVGFRPARKGGVRIGKYVSNTNTVVVDCYGFAGSGMEMSWGAAEKAIQFAIEQGARL